MYTLHKVLDEEIKDAIGTAYSTHECVEKFVQTVAKV
jgi:hypothetical protein